MKHIFPLVSVESICNRISVGIVVKPSQWYAEQGIRCFRSQNVRENTINNSGWVYITPEGHKEHGKSKVSTGDVLIVRTGAPGTACVVTPEYDGSNCIDIIIARPNSNLVLPEFLAEFINSDFAKSQIVFLQGGMAQQHLNVGAVCEMEIPLPKVDEQREIISRLSWWDKALVDLSSLILSCQHRRQGLMQQLMTGKRRFPGFTKTWQDITLGDVFGEKQERNTHGLISVAITVGKSAISLQSDKFKKSITSIDTKNYWVIRPGDFVYDPMSAYYGALGRYDLDIPGIVSPAYRVQQLKDGFCSDFIKLMLKSHLVQHQLESFSSQNNMAGKRRLLGRDAFYEVALSCPGIDEQRKIAGALAISGREIAKLEQLFATYRTQKNGLMQQLLTGKRRIKNPSRVG